MSVSSSGVGGKTKYKVVLLGDQQVGKTSVIERFINDRYETNYNATIGIDFLVKNLTLQNRHYRLQLWDTAGQERFKSLIPSYLRDSSVCLLVYDLTSPESLEHCEAWLELYNQHREHSAFSVLVGNKLDLSAKPLPVQSGPLRELRHFTISAKTGAGVGEAFEAVVGMAGERLSNMKIVEQIEEQEEEKSVQLQSSKPVLEPAKEKGVKEKEKGVKLEAPEGKKRCC